jgi:hypothetical protein
VSLLSGVGHEAINVDGGKDKRGTSKAVDAAVTHVADDTDDLTRGLFELGPSPLQMMSSWPTVFSFGQYFWHGLI